MEISENILLITAAIITALSALFCIIALATPKWTLYNGLYCSNCSTPSSGLSIVAFILLIAAIIVLLLFLCRILPTSTRILSLIVLFLGNIFTLASYASYFDSLAGYSYKLMVVAHFLCYIASLVAAFWLGGSYATATQAN
jgi:hypothetical protein